MICLYPPYTPMSMIPMSLCTGCDGAAAAEDFFMPLFRTPATVALTATIQGAPGTALIAEILQQGLMCPHVSTSMNLQHPAKELGFLAYQLVIQADKSKKGPQNFPQETIEYWCSSQRVEGCIQHYRSQADSQILEQVWSASPYEVGRTNCDSVQVTLKPNVRLPSISQYLLKPEARGSIQQLVTSQSHQGILVPRQSSCNTPKFSVPKPGHTECRLVQDLRAINDIVIPMHTIGPNPVTILSQVPAEATVFTIVDLQHASFNVPLHLDCQYLFAFTYEGRQYTWTRLLQVYIHSPTIFSQILNGQLTTLQLPLGSAVIQYVDDLLLTSMGPRENHADMKVLLKALHCWGYANGFPTSHFTPNYSPPWPPSRRHASSHFLQNGSPHSVHLNSPLPLATTSVRQTFPALGHHLG